MAFYDGHQILHDFLGVMRLQIAGGRFELIGSAASDSGHFLSSRQTSCLLAQSVSGALQFVGDRFAGTVDLQP